MKEPRSKKSRSGGKKGMIIVLVESEEQSVLHPRVALPEENVVLDSYMIVLMGISNRVITAYANTFCPQKKS
jgi:hypothetical protein